MILYEIISFKKPQNELSKEGIRCEIPSKITEDPSYQDLLSIYHDCTESDPEKRPTATMIYQRCSISHSV